MKKLITLIPLALLFLLFACQGKPKVIQAVGESVSAEPSGMDQDPKMKIHEVVVNEFMNASRYTYLNVNENGQDFWIAIPYTEVKKGEKYYYRGGVLMTNFESKEHNRVFETLYLVSGISKTPSLDQVAGGSYPPMQETEVIKPENINPVAGGTRISDLFSNPASFSDKTIVVKGQCVKVNRNIMGKNWIHIQDGSKDGEDNYFDLTVSTEEDVNLGDVVIFEGTIATNKDFGAGYRYDIIMEEAKIK